MWQGACIRSLLRFLETDTFKKKACICSSPCLIALQHHLIVSKGEWWTAVRPGLENPDCIWPEQIKGFVNHNSHICVGFHAKILGGT